MATLCCFLIKKNYLLYLYTRPWLRKKMIQINHIIHNIIYVLKWFEWNILATMAYVIANITIYYSTTGWIFWNQVSFWVITETTKTVSVYFICDQSWGYSTSCVCMTVHYMRSDVQNRSAWKPSQNVTQSRICCGGASAVKPVGIKVVVDQLSCRMRLSCINMCCTNS